MGPGGPPGLQNRAALPCAGRKVRLLPFSANEGTNRQEVKGISHLLFDTDRRLEIIGGDVLEKFFKVPLREGSQPVRLTHSAGR